MDIQFDPNNPTRPILYQYTPSSAAAYIFITLFALSTVTHFGSMIYFRSWFFIPVILGGICESFGYYGRAWSSTDQYSIKPWVLQSMLILAAPALVSATIYMAPSRLVLAFDAAATAAADLSIAAATGKPRLRWLTRIYVPIDVLVFCSQIAGVGLQATGDEGVMRTGRKVLLVGLVCQVVAFVVFGVIVWRVQKGLAKGGDADREAQFWRRWKRCFWAVYVASACILVRALVRVVEFAQGVTGSIASSEVYLYVFDALPMFLVLLAFFVWHPGGLARLAEWENKKEDSANDNAQIRG